MNQRSSSVITALLLLSLASPSHAKSETMKRLEGHVMPAVISRATHLGQLDGDQKLSLAIPLKVRDEAALKELILKQHTPGNPLFGKYLSTQEFTEAFAPTQADYDETVRYLQARGLKVAATHANRLVIGVEGSSREIENAFQLQLHEYRTIDGRIVRAPGAEPALEEAIANRVSGVIGLSSFASGHHHLRVGRAGQGTGPGGGLAPADIKKAYGLANVTANGMGETIALVEFDGYKMSDITKYATQFNLGTLPTLQNVLLDGFNGVPTTGANSGAGEVTLDIELVLALAPKLSKILVYEAPVGTTIHSFDTAMVDVLNRIATDNFARQVSISWGASEGETEPAALASENTVFMQMAAQGQAVFVASGDTGANDNGITLAVDNPSTQPYVVAVGGTKLRLNADGSYASETTWSESANSAGGGGISKKWSIPIWQMGLGTAQNLGSTTMRMIPDVALNADPVSGYAIALDNAFVTFGGTSCSAPLWAAFNALVNQKRLQSGMAGIGNPNPAIYRIGSSSVYSHAFFDINDASTNQHYPAVAGYDLGTGWGSFNGASLFQALTNALLPPLAPTNVQVTVSP